MLVDPVGGIGGIMDILIEDGKVIERGNDKELMAEDSRYRFFQELYAQANEWRVREHA